MANIDRVILPAHYVGFDTDVSATYTPDEVDYKAYEIENIGSVNGTISLTGVDDIILEPDQKVTLLYNGTSWNDFSVFNNLEILGDLVASGTKVWFSPRNATNADLINYNDSTNTYHFLADATSESTDGLVGGATVKVQTLGVGAGGVDISGTLTVLGSSFIQGAGGARGVTQISSGDTVNIGTGRTSNGNAIVDFIGDTTNTDYGFRIRRYNTGANAKTELNQRGTSDIEIVGGEGAGLTVQNDLTVGGAVITTGTTTITTGTYNALDITGISIIYTETSGGNITLNGFTGGTAGQEIKIIKRGASNSLIINHNSGSATDEAIITEGVSTVTKTGYCNRRATCDGSNWFLDE